MFNSLFLIFYHSLYQSYLKLISVIVHIKGALKPLKILEIKFLVIDLFLNIDSFYNCIPHFSNGNIFFWLHEIWLFQLNDFILFLYLIPIFKLNILVAGPKEEDAN